ncbi:hypothetical protein ACIODW_29860 [Streptomyces sp. NPDC087897]|uniref:hypothetical protein n=1 Tax=Streptomyces sp. NPDC087897 TaxID=3365817 RepID=UPI00380C184A
MATFTAYHGYKHPDHAEAMLSGLSRAGGNGGNFDPNWKGFYVASTPRDAAGYSVSEPYEDNDSLVRDLTWLSVSDREETAARLMSKYPGSVMIAGGVMRVDVADVEIVDVSKAAVDGKVQDLKTQLQLPADQPLMKSLAARNTVLRVGATDNGFEEVIIPWEIAENTRKVQVQEYARFIAPEMLPHTSVMVGVDAAREYAQGSADAELPRAMVMMPESPVTLPNAAPSNSAAAAAALLSPGATQAIGTPTHTPLPVAPPTTPNNRSLSQT